MEAWCSHAYQAANSADGQASDQSFAGTLRQAEAHPASTQAEDLAKAVRELAAVSPEYL